MSEVAQDVVVCGGCGKTYKVKPELAGKKARCKCGEAVRFPAAGGGQGAISPQKVEMAAVVENPYDIVEPVPVAKPAAPVGKMTLCKGCQQPLAVGGVICTRCGMNQVTGKKMSTQVKGPGADVGDVALAAGKVMLALILGGVTAVVCAVLWLLIIIFAHFTIGFMAIGVGAAIAGVMRLVNPYGSTWAGLAAAGFSIFSLGLVKLVILLAGVPLFMLFSPYDILWTILAVSTAYKMAAGLTR